MKSRLFVALLVFCVGAVVQAEDAGSTKIAVHRGETRTIARCGKGWLETIDGYPVVHVKGTPYEMGFQHGALLRESAC